MDHYTYQTLFPKVHLLVPTQNEDYERSNRSLKYRLNVTKNSF